jgi:hypothetical protein
MLICTVPSPACALKPPSAERSRNVTEPGEITSERPEKLNSADEVFKCTSLIAMH